MTAGAERATPHRAAVRSEVRLGRWVGFMVAGEGFGFLVPVAGFALAWTLGLEAWAAWALLVVAGAAEGALLGLGQSLALRGSRAEVPVGRWVAATAVAASVAWSIGMLPTTLADLGSPLDFSLAGTWAVVAVGGVALLATIPLAQWPVLRSSGVPRAWRWMPLNMAAWAVGLLFTFLPSPFVDELTPPAVLVALYALAGVLMALTVAVVTGRGLRRMTHR